MQKLRMQIRKLICRSDHCITILLTRIKNPLTLHSSFRLVTPLHEYIKPHQLLLCLVQYLQQTRILPRIRSISSPASIEFNPYESQHTHKYSELKDEPFPILLNRPLKTQLQLFICLFTNAMNKISKLYQLQTGKSIAGILILIHLR
jgi:hypothetical protein